MTDNNDCPMGDACAVHFRNDEEILDDEVQMGRIITYCGDFLVVTADNPKLDNPMTRLKLMLGLEGPEDVHAYETCVMHVGSGAMAELGKLSVREQKDAIRFIQTHGEWSNFKGAHEAVVQGLEVGLIDVSKSAYPEGE